MPPKSTRIRKPSNRVPTSLAAVVATSSPDPLLQSHTVDTSQIDPWLLELNVGLNPTQDALSTIEPHAFDSINLVSNLMRRLILLTLFIAPFLTVLSMLNLYAILELHPYKTLHRALI
jgi:hypothetical protein